MKVALGVFGIVAALATCNTADADIEISKQPTQNMTCSDGVCTATAKNAVLNVQDLTNMLAAADATVKFGRRCARHSGA